MNAKKSNVSEPVPAASRRWRILVVDDCDKTARLIRDEMASEAFDVDCVTGADEATKRVIKPETRPDLILLDVVMPGINGEQFCRFLKSNQMFKGIKVILCSSIDPAQLKEKARRAGADGCVHKDDLLGPWVVDALSGRVIEP